MSSQRQGRSPAAHSLGQLSVPESVLELPPSENHRGVRRSVQGRRPQPAGFLSPGMDGTGAVGKGSPCLWPGQKDGQEDKVIVEDQLGRLSVPLPQGAAQTTVDRLIPPGLLRCKNRGNRSYIPEHARLTSTMWKRRPLTFFMWRSQATATRMPRTNPIPAQRACRPSPPRDRAEATP